MVCSLGSPPLRLLGVAGGRGVARLLLGRVALAWRYPGVPLAIEDKSGTELNERCRKLNLKVNVYC